MLEKMAWSSKWLCAVVVGLSLMVGGCTTAEKSEEPMFLSVTLAQEELKGRVRRVVIIYTSDFYRKEYPNRESGAIEVKAEFSTAGLLEKKIRTQLAYRNYSDSDTTFFYDKKGRLEKSHHVKWEVEYEYDERKNQFVKIVNRKIEETGDLDPQTKQISYKHDENSMTKYKRDSKGLEIQTIQVRYGYRYLEAIAEYNEWGQMIYRKAKSFNLAENWEQAIDVTESTRTYKDGFAIESNVKEFKEGKLVSDSTISYRNGEFDEHGNWLKRFSEDGHLMITREIQYYQ